jgi:hypothetical protein
MPKRKIQIAIVAILVVMFFAGLIATFSRPSPVNVSVTFAGYTMVPWPIGFQSSGFHVTNASFSVSNAGVGKVRLTFQDYEFATANGTMLIRPSGLGILCVLKPGQSTNLVIPMTLQINGLGPDYRWRVGLSSRNNWLAKLDRQPKWLQTVVTKVVPTRWIADIYRPDVLSDWITNQEPILRSLPAFNGAQP